MAGITIKKREKREEEIGLLELDEGLAGGGRARWSSGLFSALLGRDSPLVVRASWTIAFITAGGAALGYLLAGALGAALVGGASVAIWFISSASRRRLESRRDRRVAAALHDLAGGSPVYLQDGSEVSRAFEKAQAAIESRGGTEREGLRRRLGEVTAENEKLQDRLRDLHRRLEKDKEAWKVERARLVKKAIGAQESGDLERKIEERLEKKYEEERDRWKREKEELTRRADGLAEMLEKVRDEGDDRRKSWEEVRSKVDAEVQGAQLELANLREVFEESRASWEAERAELVRARKELEAKLREMRDGHEESRAAWEAAQTSGEGRARAAESKVRELETRREELERRVAELEAALASRGQDEDVSPEIDTKLAELEAALEGREADVSRLSRENERLSSLTETLGAEHLRFFDDVSGKLRGPIQVAARIAEELSGKGRGSSAGAVGPERVAGKGAEIHNHLRRLDRLVEQVVDLCRLESSHWKAVLTQVNVRQLVARRVADLQELARDREIELTHDLPIDLPAVSTDERLLSRSLRELLVNALRNTHSGGRVTVEGGILDEGEAPPVLVISVSDTGRGIGEQDLGRIFEPFEQADDEPRFKSLEAGLGLGLTLVRHYIDRLGGRIEVESELGAGSTFTLVVPARGV